MTLRGSILVLLLLPGGSGAREPDLVLPCPGEWVTAMTASPDGRRMVTGSDRGVVRVWDLSAKPVTATEVKRFPGPVTALACLAGGKNVIAGTWEGTLVMLDLQEGKILRKYEEHRETITALAFSPDQKYFVSGSADDRLIVWEITTGEDLLTMHQGNDYDVTTLAFSPDGETIASGDGENQVKLWDAATGEAVRTLTGHREPVSQVIFGPEGGLISGSWDQTIRLWDQEKARHLKGHTGEITALRVEGTTLFSAGEDGTVRVWPLLPLDEKKDPEILTGASTSIRCLEVTGEGKSVWAGTRGKILGWHRR